MQLTKPVLSATFAIMAKHTELGGDSGILGAIIGDEMQARARGFNRSVWPISKSASKGGAVGLACPMTDLSTLDLLLRVLPCI